FTRSNLPQNRDLSGRFLKGTSGNPAGRPLGFRAYIKESTAEGNELVDVVLAVLRDQNASNRERMEAATWLADRGFGRPTVDIALEPPEDRWFTIDIGDPPAMRPKPSYSRVTATDV
ncbi:MAG: DUF5681 domain-containing protein, partial [Dehalococcoidia bacterium]|nr:DUF5681 domain-containing protein [Dehalococcoidia bacterium]